MPTQVKAEVVRVGKLEKHQDADNLSRTQVFGYPVVVRTDTFAEGDLAVYIPADSMVPVDRPEFSFLAEKAKNGKARIKPMKLRGVFSMGLLVPLPSPLLWKASEELTVDDDGVSSGGLVTFSPTTVEEGTDLTDYLGVEKYTPPPPRQSGSTARAPDAAAPPFDAKYTDVDHLRRYHRVFEEGEMVVGREKIHGANARASWQGGSLHLGSHRRWLSLDGDSIWHQVLVKYPQIADYCRAHPDAILFGEVYGRVQSLRYGVDGVDFAAFDVLTTAGYLNDADFRAQMDEANIPTAPVVYEGPFDYEKIKILAEGRSLVSRVDQIMEGIVVRPMVERWDKHIGRVCLKYPSEAFLLSEGKTTEVTIL